METQYAKQLVCESGKKLLKLGLVAGTWGNISCRIDDSAMVVTPSGIPYETLGAEDMVTVNITDLSFEGRKPSAESGMHAGLYRNRPEIKAIIHFHSLYACVASVLGDEEIPPYLEDMAQIIGPSIRVSPHALTGSEQLIESVIKSMEGRFGALLQNHGAVCCGRDMDEAFTACQILEKACQAYVIVKQIGRGNALTPAYAQGFHDYYLNTYQKR